MACRYVYRWVLMYKLDVYNIFLCYGRDGLCAWQKRQHPTEDDNSVEARTYIYIHKPPAARAEVPMENTQLRTESRNSTRKVSLTIKIYIYINITKNETKNIVKK